MSKEFPKTADTLLGETWPARRGHADQTGEQESGIEEKNVEDRPECSHFEQWCFRADL